jgi:hypothetical protein
MKYPVACLLSALVLVAGNCSGQTPRAPAACSHYIEIKLSREMISESVFIRHKLDGEDFGGWVHLGSNQQYSFICRHLPSVWITGRLTRSGRLYNHEVKLQAKYVARWAQSFFGFGDGIVTSIPIGSVAYVSADGRFRLSVPNLSQDPLAGSPW